MSITSNNGLSPFSLLNLPHRDGIYLILLNMDFTDYEPNMFNDVFYVPDSLFIPFRRIVSCPIIRPPYVIWIRKFVPQTNNYNDSLRVHHGANGYPNITPTEMMDRMQTDNHTNDIPSTSGVVDYVAEEMRSRVWEHLTDVMDSI